MSTIFTRVLKIGILSIAYVSYCSETKQKIIVGVGEGGTLTLSILSLFLMQENVRTIVPKTGCFDLRWLPDVPAPPDGRHTPMMARSLVGPEQRRLPCAAFILALRGLRRILCKLMSLHDSLVLHHRLAETLVAMTTSCGISLAPRAGRAAAYCWH